SLANETAQTYMLHVDLAPFLSGQYTDLNIPQLLTENNISAFVRGGYSRYKEGKSYGNWAIDLKRRYSFPNLDWYLRRDWLPLNIAKAEGLPMEPLVSRYAKHQEAFPASLKLTEEWGFLVGLYLAEGSMHKRSQIRFSLHKNENGIVERIDSLLKQYGIELSKHY